jgi:hypothetical protein
MTITVETDADVIIYAVKKIISFARENQYLFVANCAWWRAGITRLDSGLTIFIDNLETRKRVGLYRISMTPSNIARSELVNSGQINSKNHLHETRKKTLLLKSVELHSQILQEESRSCPAKRESELPRPSEPRNLNHNRIYGCTGSHREYPCTPVTHLRPLESSGRQ